MGFKEIIQKIGSKTKEKKEIFRKMQDQDRLETMLEERKKSANQRELERYIKEQEEKNIKEQLKIVRKERDDDMKFNHNPINAENITNHVDWHVLKNKNIFSEKGNIFTNQEFIHKSNKNLMKGGNALKSKQLFKIRKNVI